MRGGGRRKEGEEGRERKRKEEERGREGRDR